MSDAAVDCTPSLAAELVAAEAELDAFHSWCSDWEEPLTRQDDAVLTRARTAMERAAVAVRERDTLAARVEQLEAAIRERHTAEQQEAEVWWGDADHDERFPECPSGDDCEGHVCTITVCSECGYTHDGETPIFRQWPCPTVAALEAVPVPEPRPKPSFDDGLVTALANQIEQARFDRAERPERCPTCDSDDPARPYVDCRSRLFEPAPHPFHTPPSTPEEPNDD